MKFFILLVVFSDILLAYCIFDIGYRFGKKDSSAFSAGYQRGLTEQKIYDMNHIGDLIIEKEKEILESKLIY